jgi:hypothetical protein
MGIKIFENFMCSAIGHSIEPKREDRSASAPENRRRDGLNWLELQDFSQESAADWT